MKKISELLETAAALTCPVVRGIDDARLDAPTPCAEYDVRALLNHLFLVVTNFRALAAREEADFSTTPDVVTGDWRGRFEKETASLVAAWDASGAEDGVAGRMNLPARTVGLMVLGDLVVHGWDLARATGRSFDAGPALVEVLEPGLAGMAPQARSMNVFGEPFPLPAGAPAFDRVLALTGRDPGWSPAGA
ncbi:TIGR03086 family protein [Streptomyces nitrosporeus]|uniref:TIGR03086 family protein n=1 Tax=Streptomyces nitrosporeus TaxID=28894 RepID=A0A5J6FC01_9ACTN|nr:TIGR03086 family metal-binding protein [Streptomyces nitrosporeus]QEU73908.1 TIGR03086 family protein [Streptomyces nitrosporeus]GGZ01311.1 TIGR03086 family protein [Streptomyces nitrosporeus]